MTVGPRTRRQAWSRLGRASSVSTRPAVFRRALVSTASLVLFAAIVSACGVGPPPPGTGDPGNVRLHVLAAQPILKALPAGAKVLSIESHLAQWDYTYGGWSVPYVSEDFEVPDTASALQTTVQVASFFIATASKYGWRGNNAGVLQYIKTLTEAEILDGYGLPRVDWSKRLFGTFMVGMALYQGPQNNVDWRSPYENSPYVFGLMVDASAIMTPPR